MKKIYLFCVVYLFVFTGLAQIIKKSEIPKNNDINFSGAKYINKVDSIRFLNIPELEVPLFYKSPASVQLPVYVDNSTNMYFRPVTWQSGYECGQTASQAFVFTYEVNRLRNLNSTLPENQYPTHFSWNFLNDAYNYTGASFFDSWEITRLCGTPNIVDYGGALNTGGEKRWMSGYSKYYNGMKNRLSGVYAIRCDSPEGIRILKTWLFDHLEGSATGGVAAIYAQYCSPNTTLAAGTPQAGKALISTWGASPSHAWTVLGYNDSIRYDFNGDGQYTNDIDINGDGIVNVKDWEIGGIKIVNGYAGPGWGDSGFSYTMYKSLADGITNGGIWNSAVYVIKAKETHNPLLTMKVTLKHNVRNQIKVMAGVSQNSNASSPDFRMEFPIFNFKGSTLYMQGDSTENGKSIEFGLDITPLLSKVEVGIPAKYFLEVVEKDPNSSGTGQISNFSIIDYTSGVNEIAYPSSNISLLNNDTTRISIIRAMVFDKVDIPDDSLIAKIYHNYSHQLNAEFGSQPYRWHLKMDYNQNVISTPFPNTASQIVNTGNSGNVMKTLNFSFPFMGKSYNQIYIYADGYIKFDNSVYSFPYQIDADLLFRSHKMIAPFYADLVYGSGQNITFDSDANSALIVWKAGVNNQTSTYVNVALKLFSNGKIEFYYGNINLTGKWLSAISAGDAENYLYTTLSNSFIYNSFAKKIELTPPDYPENLNLTESGLISLNPTRYYNTAFKVMVADNNNVVAEKSIPFKTSGLIIDYIINSNGDTSINAGDTVFVSAKLKNIGAAAISNSNMRIAIADSNIVMLDSTENIGILSGGDSLSFLDAFKFVVKNSVNDGVFINMIGKVISPIDTFEKNISFRINSFLLKTGMVTIADGNNNILEPNETAAIMLQIKNLGGALATNVHLDLSTSDPFVTLNPAFANIDTIQPFSDKNAFFIITTLPNIPANHLIVLNAEITGNNNNSLKTYFFIQLGTFVEDFETNDFSKFNWTLTGNVTWFTSDSLKFQGNYSAKSGKITHNQSSVLSIKQYILSDGFIKFYRKVSSEVDNTNHNYDYLAFYIDGVEKARWDGEKDWEQQNYFVPQGLHTFKWSYIKDYSVNTGADCAWIDNIQFPLFGDNQPYMEYSANAITKTMEVNSIDTVLINLTNNGSSLVLFTNYLRNGNYNFVPWANSLNLAGGLNHAEMLPIIIQFNTIQMQVGTYNCELIVNENFINTKIIPIHLIVESHTGINDNQKFVSKIFPNPFSNKTTIDIYLNEESDVNISIFDYTGRKISIIADSKKLSSGKYQFYWDISNLNSEEFAEGLYFCNIKVNNKSIIEKLIYTK